MKAQKTIFSLLLVLACIFFAGTVDAKLAAVGPPHPVNGFPTWVQDSAGVTLDLPSPPLGNGVTAPTMIFDPIDPANPFSAAIGFGSEAFWWLAESDQILPSGGQALLVMGIEAAFLNGPAAPGEQFPFGRIRIRIDTPAAGNYTVTTPYSSHSFPNVPAGRRAINFTQDIAGVAPDFAGMMNTPIGPFLKQLLPAPPPGWIGDGVTLATATGSPTNFNKWRIDGPGIGGPGINFIEFSTFVISGHLFSATAPVPGQPPVIPPATPLVIDQATFSRTALSLTANVFASSAPTANLTVTVDPALPPVAMRRGANGKFFARISTSLRTVPANITVTTTDGTSPPVTATAVMTDVLSGTATYSTALNRLTVRAISSDRATPRPTLTLTGFRAVPLVIPSTGLNINNVATPPTAITIISSSGGSISIPVEIN